jgi:hypothetical protein
MRALLVTAAIVGCLTSCGGSDSESGSGGHNGGAASCAAPVLTVAPAVADAGDTVHANGKWFAADCYDTGQTGTPPALTGLTLHVSQRGQTWTVASQVDASGSDYTFDVPIDLPAGLQPGSAEVQVDGHGAAAEVQVRG